MNLTVNPAVNPTVNPAAAPVGVAGSGMVVAGAVAADPSANYR